MKDQQLTIFKLIAVSAALLYLYKLTKSQGGSMAGKYNPESIANLASQLVPDQYRPHARQFGSAILKRYVQ